MSAAVASDGRTRGTIDLRDPRRRILEATLRGIGRRGVGGLTVEAIARDAGCGRATVYRVIEADGAVDGEPGCRNDQMTAAQRAHFMGLAQVVAQGIRFRTGGIDDHFGLEFEGRRGRARSHIPYHHPTHPAIVLTQ